MIASLSLILIAVIAGAVLVRAVPLGAPAHDALFTLGTFEPYNKVPSLRLRFLMPWVAAPSFDGCRPFALPAFVVSRVSAWLALMGLATTSAYGLWRAWA